LEHHQFSKGIENWVARRCRYAKIEAEAGLAPEAALPILQGILSENPLIRMASLKALFYRLPARWFFYLIYNLIFKFPYLDGVAGLRYVFLETYSQYLAVRVLKETMNAQTHKTHSTSDI
jgi:hypothetical protein